MYFGHIRTPIPSISGQLTPSTAGQHASALTAYLTDTEQSEKTTLSNTKNEYVNDYDHISYCKERFVGTNLNVQRLGSISWYKSCGEIFNALQLVYGKEDTILYDRNGNIACFDSNELLREQIGFFIDANVFQEFLK